MRCRAVRSNDRDSCHAHHRSGEHGTRDCHGLPRSTARIMALHGE